MLVRTGIPANLVGNLVALFCHQVVVSAVSWFGKSLGWGWPVHSTSFLKWALWTLLVLPSSLLADQPQSVPNTHSPHGSLNLPCQNCHTVYGWKPIRAIPELDHTSTRFPLRGMHEGVSCTSCHTNM